MQLFWHRRDLRAADNRGLAAAASDGRVAPVFVFDPDVLDHAAPPRVAFMLDALADLRDWYRDRDSDLLLARGDPATELPRLADEHGADGVVWNADYSGLATERDARVGEALADAGLDHAVHDDALMHEPGSVLTQQGEPYNVYTPFWKNWRDHEKDAPIDPPAGDALADVAGDALPTVEELGFEEPDADLPAGGMEAARERVDAFFDGDVYRYADERDVPASDATSRLSQDLKFGTVGIRALWERTADAKDAAPDDAAAESVARFQSQLAWREFYAHVLASTPSVVTENFKTYERPIAWRDDPDGLRAWKDGETGYPFVDAGMRQLLAEGYVHNRTRMVVASFLTKDLLVDWRAGYDWFRECLVDHDTANDNGGWQWAASTGTDAQPYFRIFNPSTQCARYDPDAEYVKTYVPELRDATPAQVHDWPTLDREVRDAVAPDYPAPIVDHAERREAAVEMFERARDDE
ncbi:cryptochrome/photolyase family protein [Halobacteriaceae archaeon GCM10025711]